MRTLTETTENNSAGREQLRFNADKSNKTATRAAGFKLLCPSLLDRFLLISLGFSGLSLPGSGSVPGSGHMTAASPPALSPQPPPSSSTPVEQLRPPAS